MHACKQLIDYILIYNLFKIYCLREQLLVLLPITLLLILLLL